MDKLTYYIKRQQKNRAYSERVALFVDVKLWYVQ